MRKFRVMVGMTALIIFFHTLYFNSGSSKVRVNSSALKNDHLKIYELRLKENCSECCNTIYLETTSIKMKMQDF